MQFRYLRAGVVSLSIFLLTGAGAIAQSREADSIVGVTNSQYGFGIAVLNEQSSSTGALSVASVNQSWTGLDRTGATRTMNFVGTTTTSATYGQLRSDAQGTVTNSYYNANNTPYANVTNGTTNAAGSPDGLVSLGFAIFNDTLQFGGSLQSGYKARYVFRIDGTNSGYGALADLAVDIADNPGEAFFFGDLGYSAETVGTKSYDVNGITPQNIHVQFSSQFVLNTFEVADGTTASGRSNFSSTATLADIQITDANGNPVNGVTVTSGSGTAYPVNATPEPAALGMIGMALVALTHRSRRNA